MILIGTEHGFASTAELQSHKEALSISPDWLVRRDDCHYRDHNGIEACKTRQRSPAGTSRRCSRRSGVVGLPPVTKLGATNLSIDAGARNQLVPS